MAECVVHGSRGRREACLHWHRARENPHPRRGQHERQVASANLVFLAVVPSAMAAIGEFPAAGAFVELFLLDQPLVDALSLVSADEVGGEDRFKLALVGKVDHVVPAHDASVVDVAYPSAYRHVARERRLHIGNGYVRLCIRELSFMPATCLISRLALTLVGVQIKVISESEYHERQLRLETTLRERMHESQVEDRNHDASTNA